MVITYIMYMQYAWVVKLAGAMVHQRNSFHVGIVFSTIPTQPNHYQLCLKKENSEKEIGCVQASDK